MRRLLRTLSLLFILLAFSCQSGRASTKDGLSELREEAKSGNGEQVIEEILRDLESIPPELRVDAVDAVAEVEGEPGSRGLGRMLESPQAEETPEMKARILEHLLKRSDPSAFAALLSASQKGIIPLDPPLMKHFGNNQYTDAIPDLKSAFEANSHRQAALEALALMGDEATDRYILEIAENRDHPASAEAWAVVPLMKTEVGRNAIREKGASSSDGEELVMLLEGLGNRPYDSGNFEILRKYYYNASQPEDVRNAAFQSMVKLKNMDPEVAKNEKDFSIATGQARLGFASASPGSAALADATNDSESEPVAEEEKSESDVSKEESESSPGQTEAEESPSAGEKDENSDRKEVSGETDAKPADETEGQSSESGEPEKKEEEIPNQEQIATALATIKTAIESPVKEKKKSEPARKTVRKTIKQKAPTPSFRVPEKKAVNAYRKKLGESFLYTFGNEKGVYLETRLHNALVSYSDANTTLADFLVNTFAERYGTDTETARDIMKRGLNHPGVVGIIVKKINREYGTENMRNYALSVLFQISRWEADMIRQTASEYAL